MCVIGSAIGHCIVIMSVPLRMTVALVRSQPSSCNHATGAIADPERLIAVNIGPATDAQDDWRRRGFRLEDDWRTSLKTMPTRARHDAGVVRLAEKGGVSLSQWIAAAVAQKVGMVQPAFGFRTQRLGKARPDDMLPFLNAARQESGLLAASSRSTAGTNGKGGRYAAHSRS